MFPAERRTISTQMDWLGALPDVDFTALFEPIVTLEKQMNLPPWNPATDRLSVTDTGILVRSPHYQQWRAQVERTFEKIDAGVAAQGKLKRSNKLIVAVVPAGLASHPGSLWPKLETEGKWVSLTAPFGDVLPVLYRGVAERAQGPEIEPLERTWVFEYDPKRSATAVSSPVIGLSFDQLGPLRREFLARLNHVKRDLPALDLTSRVHAQSVSQWQRRSAVRQLLCPVGRLGGVPPCRAAGDVLPLWSAPEVEAVQRCGAV